MQQGGILADSLQLIPRCVLADDVSSEPSSKRSPSKDGSEGDVHLLREMNFALQQSLQQSQVCGWWQLDQCRLLCRSLPA